MPGGGKPPSRCEQRAGRHAQHVGELRKVDRLVAERLQDGPLQRSATERGPLTPEAPESPHSLRAHFGRLEPPRGRYGAGSTQSLDPCRRSADRCEPQQFGVVEQPVLVELRGLGEPGRQLRWIEQSPAAAQPGLEPRRQHGGQRPPNRRPVVDGKVARQHQELGGQHRFRDDGLDGFQRPRLVLARLDIHQVPERQSVAVRDQDQRAGWRLAEGFGEEIAEGPLRPICQGVDGDASVRAVVAIGRKRVPGGQVRCGAGAGAHGAPRSARSPRSARRPPRDGRSH